MGKTYSPTSTSPTPSQTPPCPDSLLSTASCLLVRMTTFLLRLGSRVKVRAKGRVAGVMLGVLSPPCSRPVAGTGCWPLTLQVTAVRPPTDARSHDHTARAYVCTCLLPAACLLKTGNVINNYTFFFSAMWFGDNRRTDVEGGQTQCKVCLVSFFFFLSLWLHICLTCTFWRHKHRFTFPAFIDACTKKITNSSHV